MPDSDFLGALRALRAGGVEFVVVGGLAVVLDSNCGPLNVLGTIGRGLGYADLLPHTVEMEIGGGVRVLVLDLATIVSLKEELGGEKDRAVLPVLRRTLREKARQDSAG